MSCRGNISPEKEGEISPLGFTSIIRGLIQLASLLLQGGAFEIIDRREDRVLERKSSSLGSINNFKLSVPILSIKFAGDTCQLYVMINAGL